MHNTLMMVVLPCLGGAFVLSLVVCIWLVARHRKDTRILKFNASDFRDLGTVTRNSMAVKDLKILYRRVKYAVASAVSHGKSTTYVSIGRKLPQLYGIHFTKLILKPFIERMTREGFVVTYLPNGSMQMEKQSREPSFEISWKDAEDTDEADELEGKGTTDESV